MRANLFVSSLFAVSLIGGVALAERPSEGGEGRHPIRDHKLQDVKPHEATTVREHAAPTHQEKTSAREPKTVKELPTRGDNIDRSYANRAAVGSDKGQQNAAPSSKTVNQAYVQARNCSDLDTDCAKVHGRPAGETSVAKKDSDNQHKVSRAQVKEMVEKLHKMMCERHASSCADNL